MNQEELKYKIMEKLEVSRWSTRCQRTLEWFEQNPEETGKIDEYYKHITIDNWYLNRSPHGSPNWERTGTWVGSSPVRNKVWSVFLVREYKTEPYKTLSEKIDSAYKLGKGYLVMKDEHVFYVEKDGSVHNLKEPNLQTALKLLDGYDPKLISKSKIKNQEKQTDILKALLKSVCETEEGYIVTDPTSRSYFVEKSGKVHDIKEPIHQSALKLILNGFDPLLISKDETQNKRDRLTALKILAEHQPEYRVYLKLTETEAPTNG